jgi:CRISPR/Cas system Type II protein with McrA/HNH and RuvC-like nuclease domain
LLLSGLGDFKERSLSNTNKHVQEKEVSRSTPKERSGVREKLIIRAAKHFQSKISNERKHHSRSEKQQKREMHNKSRSNIHNYRSKMEVRAPFSYVREMQVKAQTHPASHHSQSRSEIPDKLSEVNTYYKK